VQVFHYLDQHYTNKKEGRLVVRSKTPSTKLWPGQNLKAAAEQITKDNKWIPDFQAPKPRPVTPARPAPPSPQQVTTTTVPQPELPKLLSQEELYELQNADFDLETPDGFDWHGYEQAVRYSEGFGPGPSYKGAEEPGLAQRFQSSQVQAPPAMPAPRSAPMEHPTVQLQQAPDYSHHHLPYPFHSPNHPETLLAAAHHPMGSGPPCLAQMTQLGQGSLPLPQRREGGGGMPQPGIPPRLAPPPSYEELMRDVPGSLELSHYGAPVPMRHHPMPFQPGYYANMSRHVAHYAERGEGASFAPRMFGSTRYDDYHSALRPMPESSLGIRRLF